MSATVRDRVRVARGPARPYAEVHRDSPVAHALRDGPIRVTDGIRPELVSIGARDLKRLYGLGVLCASSGQPADVHQHASGFLPDVTADVYVTEVCRIALAWERQRGWATQTEPEPEPDAPELRPASVAVCDYLARLVNGPKAAYALACVDALMTGAPMPPAPTGAAWGAQVQRRTARHFRDQRGGV